MSINAIRSHRPLPIVVAIVVLGVAWLLRVYLWSFAADWNQVATYTSLAYCAPLALFLLWVIYRGRKWGRTLLGVLYLIHLQHWLRAMKGLDYSVHDTALMSGELALQAAGLLVLFLPASNAWFNAPVSSANPPGAAGAARL
jgi:hypothetical protein